MRFADYMRDKSIYLLCFFLSLAVVCGLLFISGISLVIGVLMVLVYLIGAFIPFLYDYLKRRRFYDDFNETLSKLDQKYLITEMIKKCDFEDGRIFIRWLCDIDRSMHEHVNFYKNSTKEFKDYIEMWCHEIKTPIATADLLIDNSEKSSTLQSIREELLDVESYVEQVLYYARSDSVAKDYFVTDVGLLGVINDVVRKNKKNILSKNIRIEIDNIFNVKSDPKWLEFIIDQIVVNSIKYSKDSDAIIHIYGSREKDSILLNIKDNGIGIKEEEIDELFNKGFTGTNGRAYKESTGIGLYLCKKLCQRLGHDIYVRSEYGKYTEVTIVFPDNSLVNDIYGKNLTEM